MGDLNYGGLCRYLTRCAEVRDQAGMKASVVGAYDGVLKTSAEAFLAADRAVMKGESAFAKEDKEAQQALEALDQPYREARSVVLAFVPTVKVPATLKALKTDTDKLNALEALLDVVDDYAGEGWADEQLQGAFGQRAAQAVKELNEAIVSNKDLDEARKKRAAAYGPAYEAYLRFKRVVRDALGPKSKEYKRIHQRSSSGSGEGGDE